MNRSSGEILSVQFFGQSWSDRMMLPFLVIFKNVGDDCGNRIDWETCFLLPGLIELEICANQENKVFSIISPSF